MTIYRTSGIVQGNEPYGRRVFCITAEDRRLFAFTLKGEHPMPTSKANREQVRCKNPDCRSAKRGGEVLLEEAAGFVFFEVAGRKAVVLGQWILAECPSCHRPIFNPQVQMFDGIAQIYQDAINKAADRLRAVAAEPPPTGRARLRRVV